ncbi:MAG: prepilin-type N-terminal cleavage/methylation domain-containing protein [Candidatus Wallbacteria bacterium]|nr:prepilin-type N-terminal cleavage/methylation domain-containing protein [Candidatus Wallbacteria bacterium]
MKKGFSLIEILIAVAFFAIGFGGLYFMFGTSNKQVFNAQYDLTAYSLARERLGWMGETDFAAVQVDHPLLSPDIINNGYSYLDDSSKSQKFTYPELYTKFHVASEVEEISPSLKRLAVTVSYRLTPEEQTREVTLERMISNE